MSLTNPFTAEAATRTFRSPLRPLTLIGVFETQDGNHILMRSRTGEVLRLQADAPVAGFSLLEIGDGWAMVDEGGTIHRLVLA